MDKASYSTNRPSSESSNSPDLTQDLVSKEDFDYSKHALRVEHFRNLGLDKELNQVVSDFLQPEEPSSSSEHNSALTKQKATIINSLLDSVARYELKQEQLLEDSVNVTLELMHRPHSTLIIASNLGRAFARNRHTPGLSEKAVNLLLSDWRIYTNREKLFKLVKQHILEDEVYDSEYDQAYRAFTSALNHLHGPTIDAYGWIPGEEIKLGREWFKLTGGFCSKCGSPEAYGTNGGLRCTDVVNCRWWSHH